MMSDENRIELGYFGKLPMLGDFIHQVLPRDFVDAWHIWLQQVMADARDSLGEGFLGYYLNCPAWKFLMTAGVCGEQAVAGLTIPSVDKVGRYFNFTLALVLPPASDPCCFVINNKLGMIALENLALDILENDYSKEEVEVRVREVSQQFVPGMNTSDHFEMSAEGIWISHNEALSFADQAGALLTRSISQNLGDFSAWWYGQVGQCQSQLAVCHGLPSSGIYLRLLTMNEQLEINHADKTCIDQLINGEVAP